MYVRERDDIDTNAREKREKSGNRDDDVEMYVCVCVMLEGIQGYRSS